MEPGLTATAALVQLFNLLRSTPGGKAFTKGTFKVAGLDSLSVAIRRASQGSRVVEQALQTWTSGDGFAGWLTTDPAGETYATEIERYRFIAGNVAGPVARETAEATISAFCEAWKQELLGEHNYVKEQFDAARYDTSQRQAETTFNVIRQQGDKLDDIREILVGLLPIAGSSCSGKIANRLAEAREAIDRDPKRTREICVDLRKYEPLTPDDSFRVATNIGVASLRLGEFATADVELRRALELQPNNPKALFNAASVALRLNQVERAVDLARRAYEIDPASGLAILNYLDALRVAGDTNRLEELLPAPDDWPADTPLAGITMLYLALDRFDDAEIVAVRAEQADPENPVILDLLACVYLGPRSGLLTADTDNQARKAEELLDRAITIAGLWETKAPLTSALLHRARARTLLRRFDEALADCAAAEASGGERDEVHRLRGLIYLELRQFDAAAHSFEQIGDGAARLEVAYPLALSSLKQGRADRTVRLLVPFLEEDPTSRTFRAAAELLLDGYRACGLASDSDELLRRLTSLGGTIPLLAVIVAHENVRLGHVDDALKTLDEASRATGDEEERAFISLQMANLLAQERRFAEAVTKYEEVLSHAPDVDATCRRIVAMYNAGDVRGALRAAQELRGDGPAVAVVSELEAQILSQLRDSVGAEKVFRLLAESEPTDTQHIVHAIQARADYDHDGAVDEARSLIVTSFTDPESLMEAARLRERLGLPDVLAWYYAAVALAPDDERAVLGFIGAHTRRRGGGEATDSIEITADCAVTLRRGDDKRIIVIAPERDRVVHAEYFASDSAFAQRLRGRREGDSVALTSDEEERGRFYSIELITSRYALASYQLMTAFPLRFPDSKAIRMGEGEAEILAEVDRGTAHYRRVLRLYESRLVSLGAAAELLPTSVPQLWGSVVSDTALTFHASVGNEEEATLEIRAIQGTGVAVDVSAALTLDYLGLTERAFEVFGMVYVARRVIDEFEQLLLNELSSDVEIVGMTKERDRYVARERSAEERRAGRQTVERLLSSLQSKGEVLPHTSLVELTRDQTEKLLRHLGESSLATLLVAKQRDAAVLSDDVVTRTVGFGTWQLPSVGTQGVLLHLVRRGALGDDEYLTALEKLSAIGYHFLRVGADSLYALLKRVRFSLTPEVQRLYRSLEGPECDDQTSSTVIADLLARLYSEPILPANVALIVDFLCSSHARGRDTVAAMKRLKAVASVILRGRPHARAEVIEACDRIAVIGRLRSV